MKANKFIRTQGKRKRASADLFYYVGEGKGEIVINHKKNIKTYFCTDLQRIAALKPLEFLTKKDTGKFLVFLQGGGLNAQADALSLALAKLIVKLEPNSKLNLRKLGLLTRDSRKKERKKPGLKRARRAPQWSKR